jgi:hypothetical protein
MPYDVLGGAKENLLMLEKRLTPLLAIRRWIVLFNGKKLGKEYFRG